MNVLAHLRQWSVSAEEWSELCRLQDHDFDPDSPDRFEVGARMADLLESYASRMEQSGLVRALSSSLSPADLRAQAAQYRAGRDPHAEVPAG